MIGDKFRILTSTGALRDQEEIEFSFKFESSGNQPFDLWNDPDEVKYWRWKDFTERRYHTQFHGTREYKNQPDTEDHISYLIEEVSASLTIPADKKDAFIDCYEGASFMANFKIGEFMVFNETLKIIDEESELIEFGLTKELGKFIPGKENPGKDWKVKGDPAIIPPGQIFSLSFGQYINDSVELFLASAGIEGEMIFKGHRRSRVK